MINTDKNHNTIINDYSEAFTTGIDKLVDTVFCLNKDEGKEPRPLRINMKYWEEGLQWVEAKVIHSNLDIKLFNGIRSSADELNQVYINQVELAKEYGVSTVKINKFIKSMTDIAFLYKKARGVYVVNPFVVMSQKVRNNNGGSMILGIQNKWKFLVGIPPVSRDLHKSTTLIDKTYDEEIKKFTTA